MTKVFLTWPQGDMKKNYVQNFLIFLLAELKIKTQKTILQHLRWNKRKRIVLAFFPLQPLFFRIQIKSF